MLCVHTTEVLELVYMNDEAGAVYQVVQFQDKLLISVNSEVQYETLIQCFDVW